MLEIRNLETSYGRSQVLFGIDLRIAKGEVVSLLGRNGMGKTTTVRSIMGITPLKSGTISFEGEAIHRLPSYRVAHDIAMRSDSGETVDPGDIGHAVGLYRELYAHLLNRRFDTE